LKPAIYYYWNTGRWNAGFYEDLEHGRSRVVKCELLQ
ncbi:unnamed protein product, partial [Musa hybrid cultivar]